MASKRLEQTTSAIVEYGVGIDYGTRELVLREFNLSTGEVRNLPLAAKDGRIYVEEDDGE